MTGTYKNWQLTTDDEGILWLGFDRENASVNTINRPVVEELNTIIEGIEKQPPKGLILYSCKKHGFVAGADISQFTQLKNYEEAYDILRAGQKIMDRIEALTIPTVAMINGFCLGGGYELALAFRYRVALDDPSTRIGLPEIKLGIYPGWGGTVRLPKLIGPLEAMKLILQGAAYPARKAGKLGMVDAVVPERELKRAALYYINKQPKPQQPNWLANLTNVSFIRPMLASVFQKNLKKNNIRREHYPAPFQVIDNWVRDGATSKDAMENEAKWDAHLFLHDTSRNLVRVFFLQERMKGLAKEIKFKAKHVHVVGAGTMGGDIAAWCAYKGIHVTLQDQSPEKIAPAIKRAYRLFKKKLRDERLVQAAMDRLQPDLEGRGVARADVVIEAIFENLEVKRELFKKLEQQVRPDCLLASNTSSIPLQEISQGLQDPSRLVGIHFFNPVAKMQLVEVVHAPNTKTEIQQQAAAFVGQIGRLPVPVQSKPGFLVNRALMPYLMEAMALLEEGTPATVIDEAALRFGMPMGPITLADKVGLDVCLSVADNLTQAFGGKVPEKLRQMVADGRLGVKSGRGFYDYKNGKKVTGSAKTDFSDLTEYADRMILRMVNEAIACLDEGVIKDSDLLDAGMIFGTGFAPFRGGPIHYAKTEGAERILAQLEAFQKQYGERFKPAAGWKQMEPQEEAVAAQ